MSDQTNRPHRKAKEKKTPHSGEKNPKAFAYATPGRLQKQAARSHDVRRGACMILPQCANCVS